MSGGKINGRVLTLEQIRKAGACEHGRDIFRQTWGAQAVVNQQWAKEAAKVLPDRGDATWAANSLLPSWMNKIYFDVRSPHCSRWEDKPSDALVCWSVFAALYVEAGKP